MKDLQAAAGCGATMKNGQIELQGDRRDKVDAHFTRQGWKLVRAGG
jgi:translation initiation factor 1